MSVAFGFSRRARRIACRAWRSASPVTAQVLTMIASSSPAATAWPRMTSDSKALRRQPKVTMRGAAMAQPASSDGSISPVKLTATGPVIVTRSSSRHSMPSVPPSAMTSARRPARPRRLAATSAALPDAQPDRVARQDLRHADIGALRKERVVLELGSEYSNVDRSDVGHEERRMRIAHAGGGRVLERIQRQRQMIGIALPRQRNVAPAPARLAHVDRDAVLARGVRRQHAGGGFERDAGSTRLAHEQIGDAAGRIAASLDLAAIGVADAHEGGGGGAVRLFDDDELVGADAGVARRDRRSRFVVECQRLGPRIDHDEIVAEPMHLDEGNAAHGQGYRRPPAGCK